MAARGMPLAVFLLFLGSAVGAGAFELRSVDVRDGGSLSEAHVYSGSGCGIGQDAGLPPGAIGNASITARYGR
jgi:hypothetical protein